MTGARGRPLLKDVAERAGVSVTTVSLVLNAKADSIPADTQARVFAAAASLGYRPNALARGLRQGRTKMIGFISDEIATTPFAGAMIQGAQDAAWEAGFLLLLVNTGRDPRIEARALDLMYDRRVDALIYATMYHQIVDPPVGLGDGLVLLLDARTADATLPSIVPDEVGGTITAMEALTAAGHRRIGFVQDAELILAGPEREAGYRQALAAHGIRVEERLIARDVANALGGWRAAGQLLDLPDPPSALFCFNDQMAMGAYRAVAERGLSIPTDISVVGFDDLELIARWLVPGLTTIALPHYAMGRWAVEFLIEALERPATHPPQQRLACPLVVRDSVGPPHPRHALRAR